MAHNLLIVEDDLSAGKALTEALKRSGFEVTWVRDADSALSMSGLKKFDLAVVDCMLPKINGVELLVKMRSSLGNMPVILMSGIYKDKNFIKTSVDKTNAVAFLTKPFEVEELLSLVKDQLEDNSWQKYSFVVPVHKIADENSEFLIQRLSSLTTINGLHLIQLLSEMMRKNVSGSINFSHAEKGMFSEVVLADGEIQKVLLDDKDSFFGILLVELGFIAQEDLDRAVEEPSYKPIGEKLVDLNSLSPHAIHLVQTKQFEVRLSRLVQDVQYIVQFYPGKISSDVKGFGLNNFIPLSWNMVLSNYSHEWLTLKYEPFRNSQMQIDEKTKAIILENSLGSSITELIKNLKPDTTIKELAKKIGDQSALALAHFVFSHGIIKFQSESQLDANHEDIERLQNILEKQKSQNYFEILGLNQQAKILEIHQNFLTLAKSFHPDKVSNNTQKEVKDVLKEIFQNVSKAYEVLKDADKKSTYIDELRIGQSADGLRVEQAIEEIQESLENRLTTKAKARYNILSARERKDARIRILNYWIELVEPGAKIQIELLTQCFDDFQEGIPLEERHSYLYFFVKGLFHLKLNDAQKAFKYFRHALVIEPNFKPARNEFLKLKGSIEGAQSDRPTLLTQFSGKKRTSG